MTTLFATVLVLVLVAKTQGVSGEAHCFEKSADAEECDNGCMLGHYGESCDRKCSDRCAVYRGKTACGQDDGYCLNGCNVGWYGDQCEQKCPPQCEDLCDRVTGDCIGRCKEGFFGIQCQHKCNENCNNQTCARDGSCKCKRGYAGRSCEHLCSINCLDHECHLQDSAGDIRVCSKGCIPGFTGYYCQELCPVTCIHCHQNGSCISEEHGVRSRRDAVPTYSTCLDFSSTTNLCTCCKSGWKGFNCSEACENCVQSLSSSTDKTCRKACSNTTYGDSCEKSCPEKCTTGTCEKTTGNCNGCSKMYYGDHCDKTCDRRCNTSGCCQKTGVCISCPDGRYGDFCQKRCENGCTGGICDQLTGNCSCKDSWIGERCHVKVAFGCASGDARIRHGDHKCVGPCKSGYNGDSCKPPCLKCVQGCHKENGTCNVKYTREVPVHQDSLVAAAWTVVALLVVLVGELSILLCRQCGCALSGCCRKPESSSNPEEEEMVQNA